jgi:hypothetical protein
MAFQGMAERTSMLLNVSDILHDPDEINRVMLSDIPFEWSEQ